MSDTTRMLAVMAVAFIAVAIVMGAVGEVLLLMVALSGAVVSTVIATILFIAES